MSGGRRKGGVRATFHTKGHLIDSGLLSRALDTVLQQGADYRIRRLDVGTSRAEESEVEIDVTAPDQTAFEQVREALMSLGVTERDGQPARLAPVERDGVAPEGFYSTTNLETRVRIDDRWAVVAQQRMDAAIVVEGPRARCVKLRDLRAGMQVVVGMSGIHVTPSTEARPKGGAFEFMSGEVSSERRLAAQVARVVQTWRSVRAQGRRVVLVPGPVVIHVGAAPLLARLLRAGLVDGLLSGNALAVHDCEAAWFGTSLGVDLETGRTVVHGHMHHMRAINRVRQAGGLRAAVEQGLLTGGVMHAAVTAKVPYCLAGSIRDDGPLPDTEMDLLRAQEEYARILENVGLVVILGSMLHGIGVGNMIAAEVGTVCVDIHPAVVAKLSDRGSAQSLGIVTDAGAFLAELCRQMLPG